LPVGDRLSVGRPKGLFTLDEMDTRPRLMIGTGTGVAPLVAMLTSAALAGSRVPTVLIHGSSFADELGYRDRLAGLARDSLPLDYRPTVSRPADPRNSCWKGRTGRAEEQLALALDELRWLGGGHSVAYLCGNPEMLEACSGLLQVARFESADIRVESFHGPVVPSSRV
jgi:ferredoxin--NADP+ reductase